MATYNPSINLPISKPLAPTKFPLGAKYMYNTSGEGGVYKFRPFQSLSEAKAYLTVNFRELGDTMLINSGGVLSPDGGSITGGTNTEYWFKDGTADVDLVEKLSGGGAGLTTITKEDTDLEGSNDDGWYLDIAESIPTGAVPLAIRINYSDDTWVNLGVSCQDGILYGFTKPSGLTQEILIKIG